MSIGVAGAGILGTAASVSERTTSFWHRPWFLVLFGLFCAIGVVGLYMLLATVVSWIPPRRWSRPESDEKPERIGVDASGRARIGGTGWRIKNQDTGIKASDDSEVDIDDLDAE